MSLNSDHAFKFGCGRYIQEKNAIGKYLAAEAKRAGTKAFVLCGNNGYKAAHKKIDHALTEAAFPYQYRLFHSTCCLENADELAEETRKGGFDLVIGVGGGVLMDTAKLTADRAGAAIITIPASSATCAAFTPHSVMYDRRSGATIGSLKLMRELDACIADLEVLVRQPARLFCAGVMDSMAKKIEIEHRYDPENCILGLDYAHTVAEMLYDQLDTRTEEVLRDMENGVISDAFERLIFDIIPVTGVVNGLSKGSNQSAVAHRFYEECRSFFYDETKDFLHGELVALGLLVQLSYTGSDPAPVLRKLEHMKLPVCLSDIGVPLSGAAVFERELCRSSAIRDESDSTRKRMHEALEIIVR